MNGDHLCYGEDMFIRNIVLLRPKTERDIYYFEQVAQLYQRDRATLAQLRIANR